MTIRIFAGYDPNEAAGYATFCHSVMTRATEPVSITPIIKNTFPEWRREGENNGATEFSFSRFLVPYLCDYRGHALFVDGADMLCLGDISELWGMRSHRHAVQVIKHPAYKTNDVKMWDQANRNYPKKNWSSVMLFNNAKCRALSPEFVNTASGLELHQFKWLESDELIGGAGGTYATYEYALQERKPVFPLAGTHGDAQRVFQDMLASWDVQSMGAVPLDRFARVLSQKVTSEDEARRISDELMALIRLRLGF